jgi:DnaJ-domain-containing protein 1
LQAQAAAAGGERHAAERSAQLDELQRALAHGEQLADALRSSEEELGGYREAVRELRSQDLSSAMDALRGASHSLHFPAMGEAHLVLRDNVRHRTQIEQAYRKAIGTAHQEVVVALNCHPKVLEELSLLLRPPLLLQ